ncbi:MAG: hypothetical protein JRE23_11015, partial [Deltaproteobacteria bacterium]|nr:hypothetical protein [Deltaproteobacteria bacterium]
MIEGILSIFKKAERSDSTNRQSTIINLQSKKGVNKLAVEIPKVAYAGNIKEIPLGQEGKTITVGGESSYPFHLFEGAMPTPPKIAM